MKKFIALLLALAMVLVLAACGSKETTSNAGSGSTASTSTSSGGSTASSGSSTDTTAADDAEADAYHVDIIYSNVFNPAEWNYKAAEKFAEMVTERTEGHITVTYHGLNELDCYADSVVHAVNGDKWIGLEEPSLFADYVGDCAVLVGPMLYNNDAEYNYVMDSDLVADVKARLAEENIHILDTHYSFGYRSVVTNKDIYTPADLKGVKLRSTTASLFIKTIEALGATPVPMSFTECLSAISSGVVDGFEGSTSTLAGAGAPYELVKKVALTNHFIATRWLFMPEDLYQSIPTKWRDILDQCALECGEWEQTSCAEDEQVQIDKMAKENGVTWNEVDLDAFTAACSPVYDWIVEEYGANPELHQQLVDMISDFRAKNG
jgi:TRAP-type C4-dicarboxylate transport system substrate-binding protein